SKIVNLVYLLDYATIYTAVMSKVDPTPIKSIDFIKSKL
ncbi:MAG: glucose-6-phosphate isomerase, partial [Patescibacteria group bacterium]|nr:glucose-6-phosphate isomerase [Patescibacteria group bacterium]